MPDLLRNQLQTTLGAGYTVLRELGGGGMSRVFVARDEALGRDVVVKVLAPELAEGLSADRFAREIRLAAGLQEPHIVPVLTAGVTINGLPYFTMPYVRGESLRARLTHGTVPVAEAIAILHDVARALAYAHRQGIVHRDIKPENVLLNEGTAVVADFGIAKALQASRTQAPDGSAVLAATLTQRGISVGTPAYMAPEQVAGDAGTDHRADLYAWGVVAYELLAGAHPFADKTSPQQLMAAHCTEIPVLLGIRRADVPPDLTQLVARCLAKDPDARPQTAREVLTALDRIGVATTAGRGAARPVVAARRRPAALAGIGVVVAVGLAAAVVGVQALRSREAATAVPSSDRSIAVLPFENLGDSADAYFADGVTDAVRGKLGELPGIRVIARASSNQYRASTKTPQEIGAELGVQYVLTATVRWHKGSAGGVSRVQVRPELITVRDAASKWQEPFDAALTDVFQVQADIASRVAGALDVALVDSVKRVLSGAPTANLAAYDAYLKGRAVTQGGNDPANLRRAMALHAQAVALDPAFALAWVSLASVRSALYLNSTPTPELAREARAAAERAEALAPGRADGANALGAYYHSVEKDPKRAFAVYETALRSAPNDVGLLASAAENEQALGRWKDALQHAQRARALDPRSMGTALRLTEILLYLRRYREATAAADTARVLAPANLNTMLRRAMISLGQGDLAGARAVLQAAPATVERMALFAYIATNDDLYWVLDDAAQQQVLALPPSRFDDDRGQWGLVRAQIYHARDDAGRSRVYADSARQAFETQLRAAPADAQLQVFRGLALAYLGRKAEAVGAGERAAQLLPVSRDAVIGAYVQHQQARIFLLVGEPDKALDVLEGLLAMPYYLSPGWLRIDPTFASLRGDPRFERLVAGQ